MSGVIAAELPERDQRRSARKNLTYLLLFSIVMFFAGLLSGYVVSKGSTDYWVTFHIPRAFWYSTGFIVASSAVLQIGFTMAQRDKRSLVAPFVLLTLLLGLLFTWSQFKGWGELVDQGYAPVSRLMNAKGTYGTDFTILRKGVAVVQVDGSYYLPDDVQHTRPLNAEMDEYKNTASSYFYVLTVAHLFHLFGGLIGLVFMSVKALMKRYGAEDHAGLWSGTLYWHFLGGLWLVLLSFLAFVH